MTVPAFTESMMSRSSLSALLLIGFSFAATTLSIAAASEAMDVDGDTGMAVGDTGMTEDNTDLTVDETLSMPVPGFAVTLGCGSSSTIYENTTTRIQCKSIQVSNSCNSDAYIELSMSVAPSFLSSGDTKTYDIDVLSKEMVRLSCGASDLKDTGCCKYTVDACNPFPDEPSEG